MTKPISRKMAVNCLLYRFAFNSRYSGTTKTQELPCVVCGISLQPGDSIQFDHIHADIFNGPHEYQNLRPLHAECHKKKTAQDIKDNSKIKRLTGQRKPKPKRTWPTRKAIVYLT